MSSRGRLGWRQSGTGAEKCLQQEISASGECKQVAGVAVMELLSVVRFHAKQLIKKIIETQMCSFNRSVTLTIF